MSLRRNILLFHQAALGDFIVTWPLALGLARAFAQSRLFYITASQKGALADKALGVEWRDVESGWHQLYSEAPQLPEPAARLLAEARWIISFVGGRDERWAHNIATLASAAELVNLSTTPPDDFGGHITEYLLEQLKPWPVIEAAMGQMLRSIGARGLGAAPAKGGPVVIHPGAGSPAKCWPVEQFVKLARQLREAGRTVQTIFGETELERWPRKALRAFDEVAQTRRPATLVELMESLAAAAVVVGNDSGPGHLAGILGLPTVCLFGPRDSTRWKPLGPRVTVLGGPWESITPKSLCEALARIIQHEGAKTQSNSTADDADSADK